MAPLPAGGRGGGTRTSGPVFGKILYRMKQWLRRRLVARSHAGRWAKACSWLAACGWRGYKRKCDLAFMDESGYTAPTAVIEHPGLRRGRHVYIGDRVVIYAAAGLGEVVLGDRVQLYGDTVLETSEGGSIHIGDECHIQPWCSFLAGVESVAIGRRCEIASGCGVVCYNHMLAPGVPVREQPLVSKGPVVIGDDVWLGLGVKVLQNVRIGDGAVIGANAVVTRDIPANAIAVGVPAEVISYRGAGGGS